MSLETSQKLLKITGIIAMPVGYFIGVIAVCVIGTLITYLIYGTVSNAFCKGD